MTEPNWLNKIRIIKDDKREIEFSKINIAINIVNEAIEKEREFFDKECLFGILENYTADLYVRIIDRGSKYEVDLAPISGEGHDFNFTVKKRSKRVDKDSFCVGELISENEE